VFFLSLYPVALKTLSHSLSLSNSYLKLVKNTKRKTPPTTKNKHTRIKQAHNENDVGTCIYWIIDSAENKE